MALGIFALVGPLTELSPKRRFAHWDRPLLIVFLVATCIAWLPRAMQQTKGWDTLWSPREVLRRPSQHDAYYRQFSEVTPYMSSDDVVLMPVSHAVFDFASITGASAVSTPFVMRVPDGGERFRAVSSFFHPKTSPEGRTAIARKYGASKVLVPSRQFSLLVDLAKSFGEPIYRGNTYAVFGVRL